METWLQTLNTLDTELFRIINAGHASNVVDQLMLRLSDKWPWVCLGGLFVALSFWRDKSWRPDLAKLCLLVGLTLGATDLFTFRILKPHFDRPRPCYQLPDVNLLQPSCGSEFGMPSNHAANAMAVTTVLALVFRRRWTLGVLGVALLIGLSRVYVGAHFPGDVLVGYLTGAMIAVSLVTALKRARPSLLPRVSAS